MSINLKEVKNTPKDMRRTKVLSVRTTPHILKWLQKNQVSITKIFHCAIKELGYKEPVHAEDISPGTTPPDKDIERHIH